MVSAYSKRRSSAAHSAFLQRGPLLVLPIFTWFNFLDCGILTKSLTARLSGEIQMSKTMQAAVVEHSGIDGRIVLHMT
jgi:hypothetical protein